MANWTPDKISLIFATNDQKGVYHYANLARKADPDNWKAYVNLGEVALLTKEKWLAKSYFLKSLKIHTNVHALNGLSSCFINEKRFKEAIKYAKEALTIDKFNATALNLMGLSYAYLGKIKAAVEFFKGATESNPYLICAKQNLKAALEGGRKFMSIINPKTAGVATGILVTLLNPFTSLAQQSIDMKVELSVDKERNPAISETMEYQNPLEQLAKYLGPKAAYAGGPGQEQYRNVDEILAGTSCKDIYPQTYEKNVNNGLAIVFFYSNTSEVSKRLAQVFNNVDPKLHGRIKLFKFDDQKNPEFSKQLGVEDIPSFFFYKNGKLVFKHDQGPKEGRIQPWTSQMEKAINKYLL